MVDGFPVISLSAAPRNRLAANLWALAKQVGIPSIVPVGVGKGDCSGSGLVVCVLDTLCLNKL